MSVIICFHMLCYEYNNLIFPDFKLLIIGTGFKISGEKSPKWFSVEYLDCKISIVDLRNSKSDDNVYCLMDFFHFLVHSMNLFISPFCKNTVKHQMPRAILKLAKSQLIRNTLCQNFDKVFRVLLMRNLWIS